MGVNFCCLFLIFFFLIVSTTLNVVLISAQCLSDQRSLLLGLKDELKYNSSKSTKMVNWNVNMDCCTWNGVGCDTSGHVISLELDEESIFGGIENSSSLFKLQYLQKLNLAQNKYNSGKIPSEISNLNNLVHLDLSGSGFVGQIPIELSYLRKLVSLDLSFQFGDKALKLENPNLKTLTQNLKNLEELYLDGVDISAQRSNWSQALASSLPRLRILSLRECGIKGPIDTSLSELRSLSIIQLDYNNLSTTVPDFFANFSNLKTLSLDSCNLFGPIPPAMTNLSNLVFLDLSNNSFTGPIPSFLNSKNLSYIILPSNELMGNIPLSIFALPSLKQLHLFNNKLSGKIDEFPNASTSLLIHLDLRANLLNESIPKFFFKLRSLEELLLSSNLFTGTIQLETFKNLTNLTRLDLSFNNMSVDLRSKDSTSTFLPQLISLGLASCKLEMFPELVNQSQLMFLDLSMNQINGEVPKWIWELDMLSNVNLSSNLLVGLQKPYPPLQSLNVLDLHSNHLQGEIPIPAANALYVDYSSNNFTNSIPHDIGNNISYIEFFSLANNRLTGSIPESLCNATNLLVLDFSNNSLTGQIPSCVLENTGSLGVLNLAKNNLTDSIPDTFPISCHLQTLDLSSNGLQGKVPGSLINCTKLRILNIGNNNIEDNFPCNLKNSSSLRVLVLRSNKFYGNVICNGSNNLWPELQIIDIAPNNFRGALTPEYFSGWRRMMLDDDDHDIVDDNDDYNDDNDTTQLEGADYLYVGKYYQNKVIVTIKGTEMELAKILKIFTFIDFSNNKFTGEIPDIIGDLKSLYLLNLSHNAFTGRIPSSIGKLKSLGSLDMSVNQLTGEIPATLASLTFLSFFNLSFNKLFGKIPTGTQLQTFTSASYEGNTGLCGWPLNTSCIGDEIPSTSFTNTESQSKTEIKWEYVLAVTGYTVGLASFISVLLFCKSWREKYFYCVHKFLFKIVKQKGGRSISEQGFRNQAMRRR